MRLLHEKRRTILVTVLADGWLTLRTGWLLVKSKKKETGLHSCQTRTVANSK